jgi:hypothetical protein
MANRSARPFTISAQHRSDLGVSLQPGRSVVATLLLRPRAQQTPEERTVLGSGLVRYQWGLGIGPNPCNKLYVMHRAVETDFELAELVIQFKSNPGLSTSAQCGHNGYSPAAIPYSGPDLGVLVISRSEDGATLAIRGYDLLGAILLNESSTVEVPAHWNGNCDISLRGDNCLASGVITV